MDPLEGAVLQRHILVSQWK